MARAGVHRIAELAKVSIGTVDRALHGRPGISAVTRNRVLRIARELKYKPHPAAQILSTGRANLRIGVCIPKEIHFYYDQMRAGIFEEARRVHGLGVEIVYDPVLNLGDERTHVSRLLAQNINALIVTPGDPRAVTPLINQAENRNIRVLCITTDAPRSRRSCAVSVDPELSGRLAAELMAKFLPSRSEAAMLTGMLTTVEHSLKARGFRNAFPEQCQGGEVVAILEAHESEQESFLKTCDLLAQHPKLAGIYVSTVNCLPVCRAIRKCGRIDTTRLITTDLFPQMVPHLERGTILASIYQDPYLQGQTAVRLLADHLLRGAAIPAKQFLNPGVVLQANLRLFREVQAGKQSSTAD